MEKDTFQCLLKEGLAVVHRETTLDLLKNDMAYQRASQAYGDAERQYNQMEGNLTAEQRDIIGKYVDSIGDSYYAMSDVMYLAGIRDTLRLLLSYGLL